MLTAPLDEGRISAVLGPTNTGKTHYAMERMLARRSGMIGFPLRLLARENYDRAVKIKGADKVALITGEEKILPQGAKYYMCTVESMPLDMQFAFVGIDEIQMCADPDRGHIFTDRLLHARGTEETMFMGAETIRPLFSRLIPDVDIVTRPRFSVLTHVGPCKINRLPTRAAIVAFTASNVYALAELLRRQRGGAAVVLGALSPRTRNAQVAMYQAGEVDFLVATDAIGMGLNMDVDHVAFAALKKFDGRRVRRLAASELAQAAGRAGRHMNDGSFGTTAEAGTLPDELAERIEEHRFDPLENLKWRNTELDFSSITAFRNSLNRRPSEPGLVRARAADDEVIFERLRKEAPVIETAKGEDRVRLLWDVCRIPDFRGVMSDAHGNLVLAIYNHLTSDAERLPMDWIAAQVKRLDRTDGDMDTLIGRIAGIRTWTYVSFRGDWVPDAAHWQERTRDIEDRLSDALHERLTQRFVDRKTSVLVAKLKDSPDLIAAVRSNGEVLIEGEPVGRLRGLRFTFDDVIEGDAGRTVANAALRAIRGEVARTARQIVDTPDKDIRLEDDPVGRLPHVLWQGHEIARLKSSGDPLRPEISVIADDVLDPLDRDLIAARLSDWLRRQIEMAFTPLLALENAPIKGAARGLAFQLKEGLGSLKRSGAADQIDALSRDDRRHLRALGVRIGRDMAFLPALLKPDTIRWRALLWTLHANRAHVPDLPPAGRVSVPATKNFERDFLEACGYRVLGPLAVRIDMAERLTSKAWLLSKGGPFKATVELTSMIGAGNTELPGVLAALGFKRVQKTNEDGMPEDRYRPIRRTRQKAAPEGKKDKTRSKANKPVIVAHDPHSPFAKLKDFSFGD